MEYPGLGRLQHATLKMWRSTGLDKPSPRGAGRRIWQKRKNFSKRFQAAQSVIVPIKCSLARGSGPVRGEDDRHHAGSDAWRADGTMMSPTGKSFEVEFCTVAHWVNERLSKRSSYIISFDDAEAIWPVINTCRHGCALWTPNNKACRKIGRKRQSVTLGRNYRTRHHHMRGQAY